jgi:ribosome-binding factor A
MSKRILKINELIKEQLGQIILRKVEFPRDVLVTITRVETSSNLAETFIFVSVMPNSKSKKIQSILNHHIYDLQKEIDHRLRMRPIPKIIFCEETEVCQAARVEELLEKINKKKVHLRALKKNRK